MPWWSNLIRNKKVQYLFEFLYFLGYVHDFDAPHPPGNSNAPTTKWPHFLHLTHQPALAFLRILNHSTALLTTDLSHFSWSFYRLREHQTNLKVLIENCLVAPFVLVFIEPAEGQEILGGGENYSCMSRRLIGVQIPAWVNFQNTLVSFSFFRGIPNKVSNLKNLTYTSKASLWEKLF